jgi:hypothetical protein
MLGMLRMWEENRTSRDRAWCLTSFIGQYPVADTLECIAKPELICVDRQIDLIWAEAIEEYFHLK